MKTRIYEKIKQLVQKISLTFYLCQLCSGKWKGFRIKNADINPIYKKDGLTDKSNYWKFRVLPLLSTTFESHIIYNPVIHYMHSYLNKLLRCFEKLIQFNTPCLNYFSNGKTNLENLGSVVLSSWTFLKLITAYHMILSLQNVKFMALIK